MILGHSRERFEVQMCEGICYSLCTRVSETTSRVQRVVRPRVAGLQPGIRRFVHMSQPLALSIAMQMAVYMHADVEAADRVLSRRLASLEANLRSFDRTGYGAGFCRVL